MGRARTAVSIGLFSLALLVGLHTFRPTLPRSGGKTVVGWARDLGSLDPQIHAEATSRISDIGPDGAAPLIHLLQSSDASFVAYVERTLGQLPGLRIAHNREYAAHRRAAAAKALAVLGPKAEVAAVPLIEAFADPVPNVADQASAAVLSLGAGAVPPLTEALSHSNMEVRRRSAQALGEMGRTARSAADELMERLQRDAESSVRATAARALEPFGPGTPKVAAALAGALRDPSASVREAAAGVLVAFGPQAQPHVEDLGAVLDDPFRPVRIHAANALGRIGAAAAPVTPSLIRNLEDNEALVQISAALALGRIGPAASPAVPALTRGLLDPSDDVSSRCAWALGKIGPSARDAVPALTRALAAHSILLRTSAAEALGGIGPDSAPAIPALIASVNNDHSGMGRYVAVALKRIDPTGDYHLVTE